MRLIKKHLAYAVLASCLFACNKTLDVEPKQAIDNDQLIVDAGSAKTAMNGLYSNAQDFFGGRLTIEMDICSDITDHIGTFPDWRNLDLSNPFPGDFTPIEEWAAGYALVYNANVMVEALPNLDAPTLDKNQLLGEARAVRAWAYFYLTNLYGDIPLVLTPLKDLSEVNVAKSPQGDILNFVKTELAQALTELSDTDDANRITRGAVHAMLAKLYLTLEDWENASKAADAVMAEGYTLSPNFMDLFDGSVSGEAIWQLDFNSNDGNQLAFFYWEPPSGRHEIAPSQMIVGLLAANDARLAAISPASNPVNGDWYVTKYSDFATGSDKPILLRLADILLVKAEALSEMGEYATASEYFNMVRERSVPGSKLDLDASNFKAIILNERMLELAWEGGHRWLDMLRTDLAAKLVIANGQDPCKVNWPIPQTEVNSNQALAQNPCY